MSPDLYTLVKAAHIVAVIVFVAGVLLASIAIRAAGQHPADPAWLAAVRRWDTRVTTPAMLLTWALGLTLVMMAHWLPAGWLIAKLAVVVVLSALHGLSSGRLRRLSTGVTDGRARGVAPAAIILAVAAIVFLVVVKPF